MSFPRMSPQAKLTFASVLLFASVSQSLAQGGLADAVTSFTTGLTDGITRSLTQGLAQGLQGMNNPAFANGQLPYQGALNGMQMPMQMPGQYPNQMMIPANGYQQQMMPNGQYNLGAYGGVPGINGAYGGSPMMPQYMGSQAGAAGLLGRFLGGLGGGMIV